MMGCFVQMEIAELLWHTRKMRPDVIFSALKTSLSGFLWSSLSNSTEARKLEEFVFALGEPEVERAFIVQQDNREVGWR